MSDSPAAPSLDWAGLCAALQERLRLKTTITGLKLFETEAEMRAVPKIRLPPGKHTADQIISMASRLNWTVGATAETFPGQQCGAILGLSPQDAEWQSGRPFVGVWHATLEDAGARQRALHTVPAGRYHAMAVAPLASARLDPPDICLIYATPGQMILLINALQWRNYRRFDWSVAGESSCADAWGRALATGEPSLSLPCFAERRYGGVPDDEMLMAMPPRYLPIVVEGLHALAGTGMRYPIAPYGIQSDVRAGMEASYGAAPR